MAYPAPLQHSLLQTQSRSTQCQPLSTYAHKSVHVWFQLAENALTIVVNTRVHSTPTARSNDQTVSADKLLPQQLPTSPFASAPFHVQLQADNA